jgi:hypothetical protein
MDPQEAGPAFLQAPRGQGGASGKSLEGEDAVRRERDALQREVRRLEVRIRHMEAAYFDQSRRFADEMQRRAARKAADAVLGLDCGND